MIVGLGIDSVDIVRFAEWHTKSKKELERIFSTQEIIYCLDTPALSAERFAARFAAREAFFKAFQATHPQATIPLLTQCKAVSVKNGPQGAPELIVDWAILERKMASQQIKPLRSLISLTHTETTATAVVVLLA